MPFLGFGVKYLAGIAYGTSQGEDLGALRGVYCRDGREQGPFSIHSRLLNPLRLGPQLQPIHIGNILVSLSLTLTPIYPPSHYDGLPINCHGP